MANTTEEPTTPLPGDTSNERYYTSIISVSVIAGVIVIMAASIWVIWLKCCKSPRSKHGVEKTEAMANGHTKKSDYYDQFNCNDNQLTVNSVTAIKWDEDEKRSNKSSGIDCDTNSADSKEVRKVQGGKRVFSVNKVVERQRSSNSTSGGSGPVVVKLPKHFSNVARSLQAGDMANFTLALIDKHSNTVHNLDLRNYRVRRAVSPVSADVHASRVYYSPRRHRHRSAEHSRHRSGAQSAAEMAHDSPDMPLRVKVKRDAASDLEAIGKNGRSSLSIESSDSSSGCRISKSLSSHEDTDSQSLLPPSSKIPDNGDPTANTAVGTNTGERQKLLE